MRLLLVASVPLVSCACAAAPVRATDAPRPGPGVRMVRFEGGRLRPAGTGDEVAVAPFLIDATEVTAGAYAACASAGACPTPGAGQLCTFGAAGKEEHPINCVTWEEAKSYCAWAHERLPSEAEWEWAARGGTAARRYPWGDEPPRDQLCWDGDGNSLGKGGRLRVGTCPVGSHPRGNTPEGLADMAGNVHEWTSTAYRVEARVTRGGSWFDETERDVSPSYRRMSSRQFRDDALGFRCARSG